MTSHDHEENELVPREPEFIGEVPVVNRIQGSKYEGEVFGTAKVEKLASGELMFHVDASGMTGEMLRRGISFGSFSIKDEER